MVKAPQEWAGTGRAGRPGGRPAITEGDTLGAACPLEGEGCVVSPNPEISQQGTDVGRMWGHCGASWAAGGSLD